MAPCPFCMVFSVHAVTGVLGLSLRFSGRTRCRRREAGDPRVFGTRTRSDFPKPEVGSPGNRCLPGWWFAFGFTRLLGLSLFRVFPAPSFILPLCVSSPCFLRVAVCGRSTLRLFPLRWGLRTWVQNAFPAFSCILVQALRKQSLVL